MWEEKSFKWSKSIFRPFLKQQLSHSPIIIRIFMCFFFRCCHGQLTFGSRIIILVICFSHNHQRRQVEKKTTATIRTTGTKMDKRNKKRVERLEIWGAWIWTLKHLKLAYRKIEYKNINVSLIRRNSNTFSR